MRPLVITVLAVLAVCAAAVRPAEAQARVRAYFLVDSTLMTASQTFKAVADSSHLTGAGGGGELLGVWKGLFLRVAGSHVSRTGQRAVVFDEQAVQTGVPLRLALTPLEIGAGWEIGHPKKQPYRLYVGGGLLRLHYKETSDFAVTGDNVDQSFTGFQGFGGIDLTIAGSLIVGGEVQYRSLRNAIGTAGVSKGFGETDLGGVTLRFLVGIRR